MAELIKLNEYIIGNPETHNVSSVMLTLMEAYRGKDVFTILNHANDAGAPGLKGIAVIDCAGSLYILSEDTTALYRNGDAQNGTLQAISSAPDGSYYLMITESVNGLQVVAASLIDADFIYNYDYSGYYERYTTNKIIGKFAKSGTSFTNKLKLYNEGTAQIWLRGDGCLISPFMQTDKIVSPLIRTNNFEIGGAELYRSFANGNQVRIKTLCSLNFSSYSWSTSNGPYAAPTVHTVSCGLSKSGVRNIMGGLFVPGDYTFTAPEQMDYVGVVTVNYALGDSAMTLSDIMVKL